MHDLVEESRSIQNRIRDQVILKTLDQGTSESENAGLEKQALPPDAGDQSVEPSEAGTPTVEVEEQVALLDAVHNNAEGRQYVKHSNARDLLSVDLSRRFAPRDVLTTARKRIKRALEYIPFLEKVLLYPWRLILAPIRLHHLMKHFEHVVAQVESHARRTDQLAANLGEHSRQIDQLGTSLGGHAKRIDQLITSVDKNTAIRDRNVATRFTDIERSIRSITADIELPDVVLRKADVWFKPWSLEKTGHFEEAFANLFRGPIDLIMERQKLYIDIVKTARDQALEGKYFLDAGCGRGEFLTLLRRYGVPGQGVEIDEPTCKHLRDMGFEVELGDINSSLERKENNSLIGISALQVIEHFEPEYLQKFLSLSLQKLASNGILLLETVNSKCGFALSNFYLDLSHIRPYPPELAAFLLAWSGFKNIDVLFSGPCPVQFRIKGASEVNYMDYAVVGKKE